MEKYNEIIKLINEHQDDVEFAEFGDGVPNIRIKESEERLKVVFPPSYVWWLKNYSGGSVIGDEIYSVYDTFTGLPSGDIVYINELDRKNGFADETQLIIQTNDQGQTFYFDLSKKDSHGEYAVYRDFLGVKTKYADDFLGFLKGRILDTY